jgi:hypothetical protein
VSYGGTSLVTSLFMVGILLSIAQDRTGDGPRASAGGRSGAPPAATVGPARLRGSGAPSRRVSPEGAAAPVSVPEPGREITVRRRIRRGGTEGPA